MNCYEKGTAMAMIARIFGVSLIGGGLAVGLGFAFFGHNPDYSGISLLLACVGGIIGAIAGAAREIVTRISQMTAESKQRLEDP